ncbi:MAG: hypothetical protein PHI19_08235 [Clostridia bacterium]|nr:hypothetical protein [Clostridia bacterium]
MGVVNGETLSGCFELENSLVETGFSTAILQGTLNNANNPNYDISFTGATLTAVQRTVRVLIENAVYEYGEPMEATVVFTLLDAVKSGETLYGAPLAHALQGTSVGVYPFSHSFGVTDSLSNDTSANYSFVLTSSIFEAAAPYIEITPRLLADRRLLWRDYAFANYGKRHDFKSVRQNRHRHRRYAFVKLQSGWRRPYL